MQPDIRQRQVSSEPVNQSDPELIDAECPESVMCSHCRSLFVGKQPAKAFISIGQFAKNMLVILVGIGICSALVAISIKVNYPGDYKIPRVPL